LPSGPICLAASLQLDFCTPNAFIQEQSLGIHYNEGSDLLDYLVDPSVFHYQEGYVNRLTARAWALKWTKKSAEMAKLDTTGVTPSGACRCSMTEW
jgi:L-alanine-DL-glutamate epimerase-like enolase superfamily enzyme